ncbi:phosphodiester glycosidase family protein [Cohnella silvisoli]|uniref:Phosphodiester glycosidase family protein n=1 Tax=Cohnella silvisoli TaxID=2873699 RepID=A0ABV1L082_9BACL|nr:phosphodiester glycosidase family protein [Cohnella silvisoli]MCD9024948.1 phosphodiester glycosidase family protein [Cohnella silvisoli]
MSAPTIRYVNRTILLACSPFLGMMIWLLAANIRVELPENSFPQRTVESVNQSAASAKALEGLGQAQAIAKGTGKSIQKQLKLYNQTNADMKKIASLASTQAARPYQIYDRRITSKLGSPAATIRSDKLQAQLFYLGTQNFRSYALKIKLKKEDAVKLVLGNDKHGGAETTLAAVNRYKAAVGVNAGGFADSGGKRYPLSTTVVNRKYIGGFEATYKDLFFVGLNGDNKLVGGQFSSKEQLDALGPKFGASFVPVLLKNGQKTAIPAKWQNSPKRAPRTVIASYKDDQLLFLVADGYNEKGSSGATLAEMQILLQRYGALDAYNLDGGGSTSLVFNGRVINNPSDGQLRKLPTNFLFFK